jgi:hypothetical protein
MDPYTAAASAVAQLGSSAINAYGASKERKMREKAAALAQKGATEFKGGKGYDPTQALSFLGLTDKSQYENMDPTAKGASMSALEQLVKRGSGSGLDIQSRQALSEGIAKTGAAQNAARQAIMQEYANKGTPGGGNELAAQLMGQQANYSNLAGATGAAAAAAEQRRLEANVLASRAGQQQQQLEQQKAAAQDTLQRFNVGARQNTLDLEKQYRQGAAGSYGQAANTMAGMANQVATPYAAMGQQVSNIGQAISPVMKLFGNTPVDNSAPQGSSWGSGWGSGKPVKDPTTEGTW